MTTTASTMIPCLRYRDAPRAIEWLCEAFGFERHLVVPGDDDRTVAHAQLTFGSGMLMLGSVAEAAEGTWGELIAQPDAVGGVETQSPYVVVAEIDAHCARAKAAGATIVVDIKDEPYGGRGYVCRDFEGHLWAFGS